MFQSHRRTCRCHWWIFGSFNQPFWSWFGPLWNSSKLLLVTFLEMVVVVFVSIATEWHQPTSFVGYQVSTRLAFTGSFLNVCNQPVLYLLDRLQCVNPVHQLLLHGQLNKVKLEMLHASPKVFEQAGMQQQWRCNTKQAMTRSISALEQHIHALLVASYHKHVILLAMLLRGGVGQLLWMTNEKLDAHMSAMTSTTPTTTARDQLTY